MTDNTSPSEDVELTGLVAKLEGALVEYVEKFGPTDRAREALRLVSMLYAHHDAKSVAVDGSAGTRQN
jgi:hypothetical protein